MSSTPTSRAEVLTAACTELHTRYADLAEGEPASYIPELARVEPDRFAIAATGVAGRSIVVGDGDTTFTIQSVGKLVLYADALATHGRDAVLARVGVAPTGDPFNAVELEPDDARAPNPMVNVGAIAVSGMAPGSGFDERFAHVLDAFERFLGRRPALDEAVFRSERATGHRNRAIGHLLRGRGVLDDRVDETLDVYFAACSLAVTAPDLAMLGAVLANGGVHPLTGERAMPAELVRDVLTVALTCGMYDYAGEWAYRIGIPAKSGVGGGIVGIVPGVGGVATFSPRLDEHGHSVRGVRVFEDLADRFTMHLFDPRPPPVGG